MKYICFHLKKKNKKDINCIHCTQSPLFSCCLEKEALLVNPTINFSTHKFKPFSDTLLIFFLVLTKDFYFFRHIKEHLKEENIDVKDENLKDEDLQFHYFKMHDYDGNSKLDGIELMNAMTHYHDESDTNSTETYTDEQMSTMIDQILNEDDTNKDGYIDYPEFIASQKS